MKFYYTNRPQGTRKWHQNWNWTPIETFLLVKSIDFQEFWNSTNKFYLVSNSNSDGGFALAIIKKSQAYQKSFLH